MNVAQELTRLAHLLTKRATVNFSRLYHGTASGDEIRKHGFAISTSGFGQRDLKGVAFSPSLDDARKYALSHFRAKDGPKPEVLVCKANIKNPIDLRGCNSAYDIWVALGHDPEQDDAHAMIREGNLNNPFFLTSYLHKLGHDAAIVGNTLTGSGPVEICIFNPHDVKILDSISV